MCAVEIHQMVRTARTVFDAKNMPSARSKMAPRQTMGHASVVAGRAKHAITPRDSTAPTISVPAVINATYNAAQENTEVISLAARA